MTFVTPAALILLLLRICIALTNSAKDTQVVCLFHEDCILPCSFTPTGAVVIHWYKEQIPVHSYYYNKDQFGLQNKHFSGRTCLFNFQIAQGNASLVLRKVKVQDKGKYKCYTSTRKGNQETYVNLSVKVVYNAMLRAVIQMVKIDMDEEKVSCMAQNIYPAPHLFWFTEPPTDMGSLQNYTRNTSDSKGLFTVESTISILGNTSEHAYICSVVSADKSQVWTASVKQQDELFGEEGNALLIPCMVPQPLHNFTFTWTFIRTAELPIMIYTYDSRSQRISNLWENLAELNIEQAHIGNGSLILLNPESKEHTGTYTCTMLSFQMKHQIQTRVNVTVQVTDADGNVCHRSWWGTAASMFIGVLMTSVVLSRCLRHRGQKHKHVHAEFNSLHNRISQRSETQMLDQPGELRHNGFAPVESETSAAQLHLTYTTSSELSKPRADGLVPPPSKTENQVLNIYVEKSNDSSQTIPVTGNASSMLTSTSLHSSGVTTPPSADLRGDRCQPDLNEDELLSAEIDKGEVKEKLTVNENCCVRCPEPELPKINGFR